MTDQSPKDSLTRRNYKNLVIKDANIFSDNKLEKISDDLIADAINDATQKAEKALVPLKQQIVGVKSVIIHDNVMPFYDSPMRSSFGGMSMESSMKSAPIMSGDEEISTNVSVVFYISQE